MTSEKVLVTGVPGWLGTRFVERLVESESYDVRCLVFPNMDVRHLNELGVEIVKGDVTEAGTLTGCAKDVDTVFHIAGIIHPKLHGIRDLYRVNTIGTINVLLESAMEKVRRFVYVSSNSAVGTNRDPNVLPMGTRYWKLIGNEVNSIQPLMTEFTPPNPYLSYGRSKLLAEQYVNHAYGLGLSGTVILRPCWFYGVGQPDRQTKLMRMIRDGKGLLFGNGGSLRSMTYIDNLCDALLLAGESRQANGETYWIADERPYTTREIYDTIAELLEVEPRYRQLPNLASECFYNADSLLQCFGFYNQMIHVAGEMNKNIACSIDKARKDLGYNPKISLKEGMRRSIEDAMERGLL